jgi:hypothetical protein
MMLKLGDSSNEATHKKIFCFHGYANKLDERNKEKRCSAQRRNTSKKKRDKKNQTLLRIVSHSALFCWFGDASAAWAIVIVMRDRYKKKNSASRSLNEGGREKRERGMTDKRKENDGG